MTLHSFFFLGFHAEIGHTIELSEKNHTEWFHQITTVLRLKTGSEFFLLNNEGERFLMSVESIEKRNISLHCKEREVKSKEPSLRLWIPFIKLQKLELALQMCTQLGVTEFVIFKSDFTDEKLETLSPHKKERLLRIITEASEQSERFFIPEIRYISAPLQHITLEEPMYVAVERSQFEEKKKEHTHIKNIMVGPEGGWSATEIEFFKKDPRFFSLDLHCNTILRAETAAVVAVSMSRAL